MMQTVTGTVTKVVSKPFVSSYGSKVGHTITVQDQNGVSVQATLNTEPTTQFDLQEGEQVNLTYETSTGISKKTNKPYSINKVVSGGLTKLNHVPNKKSESVASATLKPGNSQVTTTGGTDWAAKDLSMEVSGLLQAIIQHHGLDDKTETRLRTALTLKRTVAQDYSKGNTPPLPKQTETKSTEETKTKKAYAAQETIEADDFCPFEPDDE